MKQQVHAPLYSHRVPYGGETPCTETLDLVSASLGTKPASQQRALVCFTSRTYQSEPHLPTSADAVSRAQCESIPLHAVHLLNVTEKHKFQPVLSALLPASGGVLGGCLREQTNSGTQGLATLMSRAGVRQYRYRNDSVLKLLVVAARARADADAEAAEFEVMQADQDGGAGPSSSRNGEAGSCLLPQRPMTLPRPSR